MADIFRCGNARVAMMLGLCMVQLFGWAVLGVAMLGSAMLGSAMLGTAMLGRLCQVNDGYSFARYMLGGKARQVEQ